MAHCIQSINTRSNFINFHSSSPRPRLGFYTGINRPARRMEVIGLLFLLAFVVLVFVLPIRAAIVSRAARDKTAALEEQLRQALTRLTDQQYHMNRRIGELESQLRDGAAPAATAVIRVMTPKVVTLSNCLNLYIEWAANVTPYSTNTPVALSVCARTV